MKGLYAMGAFFYVMLFWVVPLAAFSGASADRMGCTFTEFIIIEHLLFGFIGWASLN